MSSPSQARPESPPTPAVETGVPDSFSDLADLDAEIGDLARDLVRGSDDVRPLTSFVASEASWSPFRIGRYTAVRRIGSGGMGVVYAAYDDELDRKVAIKIVRRVGDDDAPEATARMRREAQALAKLSHPNVLAVHEVGFHDEASEASRANGPLPPLAAGRFVFIVMEFVVGRTLREWWSASPRPWRVALDALVQAGRGLAAVHRAGLVHRDVKPENVMVGEDGRVRLMDFGLARARFDERADTLGGAHSDPLATPALSRSGALVGTPAYMAPEQFDGPEVGPAADQFAFGVMAWEAFFGERPFPGQTLEQLRGNVIRGNRREPSRPRVIPGFLRRALERAVATAPEDRWPDIDALLRAIARDPRHRWWAIGVPLVAVAATAMAVPGRSRGCDDREAQLGGVWDDDVRARVHDAMLATGVTYAEATSARVGERLDAHADRWMAAYTDACERGESTLSETLRTAQAVCLAERKQALAATIEVLAAADAVAVERAVSAVAALPAIESCSDVERLAAKIDPPADPRVAAQVDALRERLVRVSAMLGAGAYRAALPLAEVLAEDARAVDYPPVLAEILLRRARLHDAVAEYAQAETHLRESYSVAVAAGDDVTAADAAVDLVNVVGHRLAKFEAAIEWGFHAEGLVRRAGTAKAEAHRLENLGSVYVDEGDADAALTHYQRALEIYEGDASADDVDLAATLDGLGRVQRMRSDYAAAMENLGRALEIRETQLAPQHPSVGGTHIAIAAVCIMRVDFSGAREHYQAALEIYENAFGPDHPHVATSLDGIGWVYTLEEVEPEKALPLHERAFAIRQRALVPNHPEIATSLGYLGQAEYALGHFAKAREYYERGLAVLEEVHKGDHPQIGSRLGTIGDTYVGEGDLERGREYYERGLAVKERTIGRDHPSYASTLMEIAHTYLNQGRHAEALERALVSVAILEKALGPDHPDVGSALRVVGVIHEQLGRNDLAAVAFERALLLVEKTDTPASIIADLRGELARARAATSAKPR